MIVEHRHLLEVIQDQIDLIDEAGRTAGYQRTLKETLSTILAHEREHRVRGTAINEKVRTQVEALALPLAKSKWTPGEGA